VKYEYIVRQPRIYRGPAFCAWASFQTSGDWCVKYRKCRAALWWKSNKYHSYSIVSCSV